MKLKQGTPKGWKKLPPIKEKDRHVGCLICSTSYKEAPMDLDIPVGFGWWDVTKDGVSLRDEKHEEYGLTVEHVEQWASEDPDHDWRIVRETPLHGETYQRQDGKWVCVESTPGFA